MGCSGCNIGVAKIHTTQAARAPPGTERKLRKVPTPAGRGSDQLQLFHPTAALSLNEMSVEARARTAALLARMLRQHARAVCAARGAMSEKIQPQTAPVA